MDNLQNICMEENVSISEGIKKLDQSGKKILLVTRQGKLVGVVTDGDVRRWILKKGSFDANISKLMHTTPQIVYEEEREHAKALMLEKRLEAIPVISRAGIPLDVIFLRDMLGGNDKKYGKADLPVVIMAGGKGTRLYPFTQVLPKPLIPIGSTTILERIMDSFLKNGCNDFWLTLNYKKDLIKAYFNDKNHLYKIHYVEEEDYWGTCGSISGIKGEFDGSFFVSNCDVLLDIDYSELLDFHKRNNNEVTAVASLKHMQVPYGVFEIEDGGKVKKIVEKPEFNYTINTGIYVMESTVIKDIPEGEVYHMTDLINKLLTENRNVGAFPVTDKSWKDMGEIDEMRKMIDSFQHY